VKRSVAVVLFALAIAAPGYAQTADRPCLRGTFPSTLDKVPADWKGSVFKLKQDYPDKPPPMEAYPWRKVSFNYNRIQDPQAYVDAVKQYILEGNTEPEHEFSAEHNKVRKWYNLPWMDYGAGGNEFTHGLVHELDRQAGWLSSSQTEDVSVWAITIVNERAAYGVGQVWCDPQHPQPNHITPNANRVNSFPEGSVVAKALFFTMGPSQVPFLEGSLAWDANFNPYAQILKPACNDDIVYDPAKHPISCPPPQSCNIGVCFYQRKIGKVWLAQLDFAVRDSRATESGWVFGTWVYNSKLPGTVWYDKLISLGATWGNDPGVTPAMSTANPKALRQTWINAKADPCPSGQNCTGIFGVGNHIGYGGRLDGPADEKTSACLSCHMTAGFVATGSNDPNEIPQSPVLFPDLVQDQYPMTDARRMAWFNNTPAGVPLNTDMYVSLDYSIQMAMGITHFYLSKASADERKRFTMGFVRALPPK
jgi:hypothetical protein